ncbi:hypothetical protein BGZ65_000853 [Modicella reniformis]|uniref:Uncharacterized protein n=1 Tax=Modicella reniformis TaxID=1440133 RepID=A0A9P6SN72_9FUNG|nr:hypothetical protein BGZ65_000853 [Modicella reniformis]
MVCDLQQWLDLFVSAQPNTEKARQKYITTTQEITSQILREKLLQRFQLPGSRIANPTNEQQLSNVLDCMRQGLMTTAVNILVQHWQPTAIDAIIQAGVEIYNHALDDQDKAKDYQRLQIQILVSKNVHNRVLHLDTMTFALLNQLTERQQQRRQTEGMAAWDETFPTFRPAYGVWQDAFYDFGSSFIIFGFIFISYPSPLLEFVNLWFFFMRENYATTKRLSVEANNDSNARTHHLAYLVCYWNSLQTRCLMDKTDADDQAEPRTSLLPTALPVQSIEPPSSIDPPICLKQESVHSKCI